MSDNLLRSSAFSASFPFAMIALNFKHQWDFGLFNLLIIICESSEIFNSVQISLNVRPEITPDPSYKSEYKKDN